MAATLEMEEMREEIERLNAEVARLKAKPEPSSQELMDYPLPEPEVKVESEPEVKVESEAEEEQPCYEVFVEKWEDYDDLENDGTDCIYSCEFPIHDLEGATSNYHELLASRAS